ncbi:gas vesicle protein [Nocardia paucivorans]|uniref:gas vesicle protein n=1 Tax=Nocardia paucivorans TaxID=114259 RepID=UPI00031BCB2A|nr:gas vesicle protein [Nocardia paucivorans]
MSDVDGERRIALVDLLDRVLAGGVVVSGDIKLAIADVDLVQISLRALLSSIGTLTAHSPDTHHPPELPE